ncbi:hypothetical protein [Geminocystis herdmanii]|uniref:hypothetical protein n=1 Tax=Geminocystis herdmanii TaxID=669359 RepID=UPI000349A743|nr:hypothetical protein [Geminocystis herdmanii]
MVNRLREEDSSLTTVDYSLLFDQILEHLDKVTNPFTFSKDNKRLKIDMDSIAYNIALSNQVQLPADCDKFDRVVSVNFSSKSIDKFPEKIRQIRDKLKKLLLLIQDNNPSLLDTNIENILTDITKWKSEEIINPKDNKVKGFKFNFNDIYGIKKQELSLPKIPDKNGDKSILKLHRLTITVSKIKEFEAEIKKSLETYVKTQFNHLDSDARETLEEKLEDFINYKQNRRNNKKSEIENLIDLIKNETVARLKKEAQIHYLRYILQQEDVRKQPESIYLEDLIRRIKLLEDYLNDNNKSDTDYQVNYEGLQLNYKDLLARGEAYNILPVIPIIEGYLGESSNEVKGEKSFSFALKLKLNGGVKNQGENTNSSFAYYLNLLNPHSSQHKEELKKGDTGKRKILRIALLFTFIFASRLDAKASDYDIEGELTYNPLKFWENDVMKVLQENDEEEKKKIFHIIYLGIQRINAEEKIQKLVNLLKKFLEYKSQIPSYPHSLQIGIHKNILETDAETINTNSDDNFFRQTIKTKDCLKYLVIGEAIASDDYLYHLPVSFTIEDIRYYDTQENQTLKLAYNLTNIKALPILFVPLSDNKAKKLYQDFFEENKDDKDEKHKNSLIVIDYNHLLLSNIGIPANNQTEKSKIIFEDYKSPKAFIYRFVFALLIYLAMEVILESVSKKIFIPIMRLHIKDRDLPYNEEHFIRSYSKILAHLLRKKHLANAQGLDITEKGRGYRLRNGLTSLYSVLPKSFIITNTNYQPKLEKLALIIVSSREADANYKDKEAGNRLTNLYGETIRIMKEGNKITVRNDQTFNDNYNKEDMYQNPTILVEEVERLYKQGFRHFLYIAKSPYSSNLNVTHEDKDLYFMSKAILKKMKGEGENEKKDIRIYPIFFDKYYVVSLKYKTNPPNSFYIQNTEDLGNLFDDESQKSVVFFNLFNGLSVGKAEERNYRGVMSYSTLLNTYQGILDNQDISQGLIYDKEDNNLKDDILQYLTLFHFSRYEQYKSSSISLKLNPYESIIGESSVGKDSILPFNKKTEFNLLAFLSDVKRALF